MRDAIQSVRTGDVVVVGVVSLPGPCFGSPRLSIRREQVLFPV